MASYVLFRKSNQATSRRSAQQAVGLARAAQRVPSLTPRIRALAAQQEAQGHALLGNPKFALAKFDEAHALAAVPDEGDPDVSLDTSYCTPTYIEMQRANCWVELGDPMRAVELFKSQLRTLPQIYRNDQGVYLSRLARAYATAREPEEGAASATKALAIAYDTGSARAMSELAMVDCAMEAWESMPAVSTFRERFRFVRDQINSRSNQGR